MAPSSMPPTRTARQACALITLLALACACSDEPQHGPPTIDTRQALEGSVNQHILPLLAELDTQSARMQAKSATFCERPDATLFAELQRLWLEAQQPLKASEAIAFGPYLAPTINIPRFVDPLPPDGEGIDAQIEASGLQVDAEALRQLNKAGLRGMPAIGYMILRQKGDAFRDDYRFSELREERCAYLLANTALFFEQTQRLKQTWSDSYAKALREPGSDPAIANPQAGLDLLLDTIHQALQRILRVKLRAPLGLPQNTGADPSKLEAPYSGSSALHLKQSLEGILDFYQGSRGGLGNIAQLHKQRDGDGHQRLLAAFEKAIDTADDLSKEPALADTILDDKEPLERAEADVADLIEVFEQTAYAALHSEG